jgi:hypothetical protein
MRLQTGPLASERPVQDCTDDFVVEEPGCSEQQPRRTHQTPVEDFTDDFAVEVDPSQAQKNAECFRETDPHRISQRQRQIDFGKNTIGYQRLCEVYPAKQLRPKTAPRTPDVHKKCSKRAFDGLVRQWRRHLHEWDFPEEVRCDKRGRPGEGDHAGRCAPADPRRQKCGKRGRDETDDVGPEGGSGIVERCDTLRKKYKKGQKGEKESNKMTASTEVDKALAPGEVLVDYSEE